MLNKLKFNNLVLSNKKGIQLSRIQTINKLVHKIRKLKVLLEKHPDNTKCKESIRKSTETMELLKKLKTMDIMKKVLLLDKPAPAVITNGLATPEEVGVALLCMNKVMQGLSKRFKTELQLNEAENDEWKQVLMESSKRRQKIDRIEEKRRKRMEMKKQKTMARKRQEWLEENQLGNEVQTVVDRKDVNISTTGGWQVEELSYDNGKEKEKEKIYKKSNKPLMRPIKEKTVPSPIKQRIVMENNKDNTDFVETEDSEEDNNKVNEMKPVKVEKHKVESPQYTEEEPEEEMVVDPFFITDTGENYLSTAVIKVNKNNEDVNNEEKKNFHMIKLNNYDKKTTDFRDRRQSGRDKNQRDFAQNRHQNNKWSNGNGREQHNNWNNKQRNGRDKFSQNKWNDSKQTKKYSNNSEGQNLHPSWAAKQKIKPIITGFQAKKITFGGDDSSIQTQNKTTKCAAPKTNKLEQDSLHPSWAAKKKLKPTITAFQGKKITFENDE